MTSLQPLLHAADLVFANLECSLAPEPESDRLFQAPLGSVKSIGAAGFTHLHMANNHCLETGPRGLELALTALRAADIHALGADTDHSEASHLHVDEVRGLRIGWLACGRTLLDQAQDGPGFWELDEEELSSAVAASAPQVDVLIVSIHAGYMLVEYPSPHLRALAHRLCQAGAHLILMHHPHVLQGVEVLENNKVICYSLGNLLFDWREGRFPAQVLVEEQNEGALFYFDLDRNGVASVSFVPTVIEARSRVRIANSEQAERIAARVRRLSREIQGDYLPLFERQRAEHNTGLTLRTLWHHLKRGEVTDTLRLLARIRPHHLRLFAVWLLHRRDPGSET